MSLRSDQENQDEVGGNSSQYRPDQAEPHSHRHEPKSKAGLDCQDEYGQQ
ncbi:MAG: hypothetical protein AB7W16_11370 [Candidatus Obscuribacterales bacterium]